MKQEHRKSSSSPARILLKMGRRDIEQKVEQTEASRKYFFKKKKSVHISMFQEKGLVESKQFIKLVTNMGKKKGWLNNKKKA